jgi:YVTN family beta-propeller protein
VAFAFSSCEDDESKPIGQYEAGTFVVNEGNFQRSNSSVSNINASGDEVTNDLFKTANGGLALGDVAQSMTIDGDLAYVVVNNDNKIEVVNVNTFASSYTIAGLKQPRYFTTFNGKGYVTEWANYGDPGRVSVIDLQSHAVTTSIVTDYGAEHIIEARGNLYVSNTFSNTVSVINPATEKVTKTFEVGEGPGIFVVDQQQKLWVLCGGGSDDNYEPLNNGKLVQIDPATNAVVKTIELNTNTNGKLAINNAGTQLLYAKGKSVYKVNITDTMAPSAPLLTESTAVSFYGIGIDPDTDIIYVADSKGFQGNGTVYRYTLTGTAINNVTVGVGPSCFVF